MGLKNEQTLRLKWDSTLDIDKNNTPTKDLSSDGIKVKEKCESNDAWSQENPTQNHKTLTIKSTLA